MQLSKGIWLSFLFLSAFNAFAQQDIINLNWNKTSESVLINNQFIEVTLFEGAIPNPDNHNLPLFFKRFDLVGFDILESNVISADYEACDCKDLEPFIIDPVVSVKSSVAFKNKRAFGSISFTPFRKNSETGKVERVKRITLEYSLSRKENANRSSRSYAAESVLKDGQWFKIAVSKTGIHKIDHSFLTSIGINGNPNFFTFGVFGQGGHILPEENADFTHDDLVENALKIVDANSNGVFEPGDYVLFYAQGTVRWSLNSTDNTFVHQRNNYSEEAYYFVSPTEGSGKQAVLVSNPGSPNTTANTYTHYDVYESDEYNLIKSGREWYGDRLTSINSSKTINFNVPDIVSGGNLRIRSRVAARSSISSTQIELTYNSNLINTHSINTIIDDNIGNYARLSEDLININGSTPSLSFTYNFKNSNSLAEGWIDFLNVNAERYLSLSGNELLFRNNDVVGLGNITSFNFSQASGAITIWDVTDISSVRQHSFSSGSFIASTDILKEFVAFKGSDFPSPDFKNEIANQNLHGIGQPDMIIVSPGEFLEASNKLAQFHESSSGLDVEVVEDETIYNEFGSGIGDASSIRNFMKMLYDRAGANTSLSPQYLLLMGDGSYDHIPGRTQNNNGFIPTYQSPESLNHTGSFTSDDYFGLLDDVEGGNIASTAENEMLDLAIGRLPVISAAEAIQVVDKILHYAQQSSTLGNWRNNITFIADDEDSNIHINDADKIAQDVVNEYPNYNVNKIYFDAFQQLNTPAGDRYPDVNVAIEKSLFNGSLILNYTGHGGVNNWAHERVFNVNDIQNLDNKEKLPLFVTATCEFSKYDNPLKKSAGEFLVTNPNGGAIAMVTTVRIVYAYQNFQLNNSFFNFILEPKQPIPGNPYNKGIFYTVGEAITEAKNAINGDNNNRKFVLLGDPALKLVYPQYNAITTEINDQAIGSANDTMKALANVKLKGEILDDNGNKMTGFNGVIFPTIYDKTSKVSTLKNDSESKIRNFDLRNNILFKGKASVVNGEFEYEFIVPKDINYSFGNAKISYYAEDNSIDANGSTFDIVVGGSADDFLEDNEGPLIELYMNDENFRIGGLTGDSPLMLVKLEDESGINTVGNGIGHDITAVLDGDDQNKIILNDFYESELDNFQKGEVRYPLANLANGLHTLTVKAWDIHNNSSEAYTEFVVSSSAIMALENVMNYPNPFSNVTNFVFEHNKAGEELDITINIFTISGELVKSISESVVSTGYRIDNIQWNGTNDSGRPIGNGMYVYQINVRGDDGVSVDKFEKLVILR